jgi:hypothetical protein
MEYAGVRWSTPEYDGVRRSTTEYLQRAGLGPRDEDGDVQLRTNRLQPMARSAVLYYRRCDPPSYCATVAHRSV